MTNMKRYIWFIVFILGISVCLGVFSLRTEYTIGNDYEYKNLKDSLKIIRDSIETLHREIAIRDSHIIIWEKRMCVIDEQLKQSKETYEKTNDIIINADVDESVVILSGFLSEDDDFESGYFSGDY